MTDRRRIVLRTDQGIDWASHRPEQARERLAVHRGAAHRRRLQAGARRYQPSRDLVNAIDAALMSGSPLLLTGDPGTGKTQVAWFLAEYFKIPLFDFQVRSDTVARDLRYDFDAVAYLRDAYLSSIGQGGGVGAEGLERELSDRSLKDPRSLPRYLKPGMLWRAYVQEGDCVLLIDEIDKAPRDFPNDLLQELADYRFAHPFEPDTFIERGDQPTPIVVVTSNGERRLPDPFLRRCVLHHIVLDEALLRSILDAWADELAALGDAGQAAALGCFMQLRERLAARSRAPGAAELLIWLTVLNAQGIAAEQLAGRAPADLPALECLIKDHEDLDALREQSHRP